MAAITGNWNKLPTGSIVFFKKEGKSYGWNGSSKKWSTSVTGTSSNWKLATNKEVEEMLIAEAKRRGLWDVPINGVNGHSTASGVCSEEFNEGYNKLWSRYGVVFHEGKWATVVKSESVKDSPKESKWELTYDKQIDNPTHVVKFKYSYHSSGVTKGDIFLAISNSKGTFILNKHGYVNLFDDPNDVEILETLGENSQPILSESETSKLNKNGASKNSEVQGVNQSFRRTSKSGGSRFASTESQIPDRGGFSRKQKRPSFSSSNTY